MTVLAEAAQLAVLPAEAVKQAQGMAVGQPHPLESVSFVSFIFSNWVSPLLDRGAKQALEMGDIWDLPAELQSQNCGSRLAAEFARRPAGGHRLLRSIMACFGGRWVRGVSLVPLLLFWQTATPLLLKAMISYINNEDIYMQRPFLGITNGWVLSGLLCMCSFGISFCMQWQFVNIQYFGVHARAALMDVLFRKAMRLSESAMQQTSLGQIMTLVSADLERIFLGSLMGMMLLTGPGLITICGILLIFEVGIFPMLAGFAFVAVIMPLNVFLANKAGASKRKMLQLTDARVRFMTEILRGIRIVKLHSWEESVEKHVQSLRDQEVKESNMSNQLTSLAMSVTFVAPGLMPFFIFIAYVSMNNGEAITIDKVFAVLALMNTVRMPMMIIPRAFSAVIQMQVSLKRIEQFMLIPDREAGVAILDAGSEESAVVELREACCRWGGEEEMKAMQELAKTAPKGKGKGKSKGAGSDLQAKGSGKAGVLSQLSSKGDSKGDGVAKGEGKGEGKAGGTGIGQKFAVDNVSLTIPAGQHVAVVGRVGSGKSSLLSAMCGELVREGGLVQRASEGVAYCAQQPWIQSDTVKANILFGQEERPELYTQVLKAAQLKPDLQMLTDGDLTSIGENGINLSGGQKARVSIARALYFALLNNCPLVLFDDPIAAVDAFVAHALFEDAFSDLLKSKAVVLTLNAHLELLGSFDRVLVLDEGRIVADGSLSEVAAAVPWLQEAVGDAQETKSSTPGEVAQRPGRVSLDLSSSVAKDEGKKEEPESKKKAVLYQDEDRVKGRVQWQNFVEWAQAAVSTRGGSKAAGYVALALLITLFMVAQVARVALDAWCAKWAQEQLDFEHAISVYAMIAVVLSMLVLLRAAFFTLLCMRSCANLHLTVLHSVLLAPINVFFDITPSGRILNRFSGDLNKLDEQLPQQMLTFLQNVFTVLTAVIMCAVSTPFTLIGIPFLAYLFFRIVGFYQKSAREIKRLDMISRSPVLQSFSESLRGLGTVRAYGASNRFADRFSQVANDNCKVFMIFWFASRWLAVRVDACAAILQAMVCLLAVGLKDSMDPVIVGIALVWGFQLSGLLQFVVRNFSEVENTMTGVERLVAYKSIPQEAPHVAEAPPTSWPKGEVEFRGVSARYRPGLPLVLKDVNLHILPGERLGLCGRTGSGKSTLGLLLFRIIELDAGQILIDGVDTSKLGLRDLRQGIAMIPQDPVLFRMSVRQNIDPFSRFDDARIWECLRFVCMDKPVEALGDGLGHLCAEGGTNFSVGQMQLLCIARSMLQEPGMVMMDEATANVDVASDEIIQRAIREHFKSATVLTIAHRLSTIVDSSKIAVFDQGELKEFGSPQELAVRSGGLFRDLVMEAQCEVPGVVLTPDQEVHQEMQE